MTIYLLLILLCFLTFHLLLRYHRKRVLVEKIPGPPSLPFLGNLVNLYGDAEHLWNVISKCSDQYYPTSRLWATPTSAFVMIRDPDDLEILLSSKIHIEKGTIYAILKSWGQDGIVLSKAEKSLQRRKLTTQAFHLDNLKRSAEISNKHGDKLIEYIKSYGNESIHDFMTLSSDVSLDIFCDASLGVDLNNINREIITKYRKAVPEMLNLAAYRVVRPYIKDWMMPLLNIGRNEKKLTKDLHRLRDEIIKKRRSYHDCTENQRLQENFNNTNSDDELKAHKVRPCMLDLYFIAKEEGLINDQGIEEEVDNFIITGYDTVGVSVTYILMLLAENKKIQDQARIEVTKVLDQTGGKITMTEIQKFNYIERCIKEALRLFPAVPISMRYIQQEIQLKNYLIPIGHNVICMTFKTHRDPQIWPEPNKFDPDRFLSEHVKNRHPYAYLPFGAGLRNCPGQKLAMVQMKVLVAKILYHFSLEPIDMTSDLKFAVNISLHPTNPVQKIKFIKILK